MFAAALSALSSAAPATERHGYVASNDGKGHWLHVLLERADVTGPACQSASKVGSDAISITRRSTSLADAARARGSEMVAQRDAELPDVVEVDVGMFAIGEIPADR